MDCNKEALDLMHKHLDGDISREEEAQLINHLEGCMACQKHLHELKRTITLIQSTDKMSAPEGFANRVMQQLPVEKKHVRYMRWFKMHPVLTAAAIFFVFMFTGLISAWEQDSQLMVSNPENLIIEGHMVIVPEGVTVEGDLVVQNGNLKIDGTVNGNVTLINGKLVEDNGLDQNGLMANAAGVNGELKEVNRIFEWVWYHTQNVFKGIFSME
ncbi:anti-sigma factor [Ornithinibacillus sp. BX22]|uniref:Anti-sigma-W factor RsiW n=2 Tax=Ornithinibacillus TaxID=484508 RepID=A0A923L576_9BACI|nr:MULTISPECIES: zf-HC2 domain-containing protein [Ornithinibacillus]MBC5636705.1 anti-sigma factor [Ornithinibacillus hominis]MBS3681271.1 anti-sigma factor [Ornithinibacillus massiliensis]